MTMKYILKPFKYAMLAIMVLLAPMACDNQLDEPLEGVVLIEDTDYTQTQNMDQLLTGAYELLYFLQWESFPTISVRGDDVNAAGDQFPLTETDQFRYDGLSGCTTLPGSISLTTSLSFTEP